MEVVFDVKLQGRRYMEFCCMIQLNCLLCTLKHRSTRNGITTGLFEAHSHASPRKDFTKPTKGS